MPTLPDRERFLSAAMKNDINRELIARLPRLHLPECYLVSGCLFQTVWNVMTGRSVGDGILDYDVFYFDSSDSSWEAEDAVIRGVQREVADLGVAVQVRNQARVHLWYAKRFGIDIPPLRSTRDGIDHFLVQAACVGVSCDTQTQQVYAPFGFDDLFSMIVRPNARRDDPETYYRKSQRWADVWPTLRVLAWPVRNHTASASAITCVHACGRAVSTRRSD